MRSGSVFGKSGLVGLVAAAAMAVSVGAVFAQEEPDDDVTQVSPYPTTEFAEGAKEATVSDGAISVRVFQERRPNIDPDDDVPVFQVSVDGKMVLEHVGSTSGMSVPGMSASIAEIDPTNDTKEVYLSNYTGGAHCCSEVVVATKTAKGWVAVDVGAFDGDGDYLQDLDNDGVAEIVTVDNRFLYAFDCYACSAAPLVIRTVRDGKVVDVTNEPRFAKAHREWLKQLEDGADPDQRWKSPGFLAGWVAQSVRAGEGEQAFQALKKHWDLKSDEGEEACLTGPDVDSCPKKDLKVLKFPERLKLFLDQNGYKF
ncbi:hypothetical protein K32_04660 [Kaistia sp. 32K]|uniref:hypothetical protein n=1 Tax=Kaistia sp. 32K TaxID=2795690 RepID=UPI0019168741|nr:hypothetical protein [Kaistia sp. 32K]BCP51849.1 hypothetical protein K32_04660 [Kaistia sp. 32K]